MSPRGWEREPRAPTSISHPTPARAWGVRWRRWCPAVRRSPADFGGTPGVCDTYGAEGTAGGGFSVYASRGLAWDAGSPALNGRRRRVTAGGE